MSLLGLQPRIVRAFITSLWMVSLISCRTSSLSSPDAKTGPNDSTYSAKGKGEIPVASCEQDQICTREFRPHICKQDDVQANGSNLCEAQKELKEELCKQKKTYDDKKLVCIRDVCEQKVCTMMFEPVTCRFDGKVFKGSNNCDALNKIRVYVCKENKDFSEEQVTCVKDESAQSDNPIQNKPKK